MIQEITALAGYCDELQAEFGAKLIFFGLCGSYGLEQAGEYSDVDVIAFVNDEHLQRRRAVRDDRQLDVFIWPMWRINKDLTTGALPITVRLLAQVKPIYDPQGLYPAMGNAARKALSNPRPPHQTDLKMVTDPREAYRKMLKAEGVLFEVHAGKVIETGIHAFVDLNDMWTNSLKDRFEEVCRRNERFETLSRVIMDQQQERNVRIEAAGKLLCEIFGPQALAPYEHNGAPLPSFRPELRYRKVLTFREPVASSEHAVAEVV